MDEDRLLDLLNKFQAGSCSTEEIAELEEWYASLSAGKDLDQEIAKEIGSNVWLEQKYNDFRQLVEEPLAPYKSISRPLWTRKWLQIAAGLTLLVSLYFLIWYDKHPAEIVSTSPVHNNDVPPGTNKAILTLANGEKIVLDNTAKGAIADQGGTRITKPDSGQLAYVAPPHRQNGPVLYNMISTPRGGQYRLTLPDGSNVWLNAASSLRYPTVFVDGERTVEVTGEVYFEVAKNSAMPFKVRVGRQTEVEVLGTHFNVNAYQDEGKIRTTLLEGSVKVTVDRQKVILHPGQQAEAGNNTLAVHNIPEAQSVVAWKDGFFHFDNASLESVMRQIARWYNMEVSYQGTAPTENLTGRINRNTNLSTVLGLLQNAGVNFEVHDNRITINR